MALTFPFAANPARYARRIRERPAWAGRFFLLAALYILLGVAGGVYRADLTAGNLPALASTDDRFTAREAVLEGALTRSLFLPVRLFIGWSAFAFLLYHTSRIWSTRETPRYVHFLAAGVHAEGVLFIGNAAAFVVMASGAVKNGPTPPWIPGGLDLFVRSGDFALRYVLNSFNIFSAAYVAILTVTLSMITGVPRTKTLVSVLLAWGINLFLTASIFRALMEEFHLEIRHITLG